MRQAGDVVRRAAVAAIDNGNPTAAVEWLEQGRSVIWGQLFNLRLPIDDLMSSCPALGHQLLSLSSKLEGANFPQQSMSSGSSASHESLNYHKIAYERELIINKIRQQPGFEHFLLPKPLSELSRASQLGPVVMLNASEQRCDALVLIPDLDNDVLHIPLPDISLAKVKALHNILHELLRSDGRKIDMLLNSSRRGDMERLGIILVSQEGDSPQGRLDEVFKNMLSIIWDCVVKPIIKGLALTVSDTAMNYK